MTDLESTANLLVRVRAGDSSARDTLLKRYLPALRRFAHGRLPRAARDVAETDDLVQNTVTRALQHLEGFDARRPGAFLAYLRQIVVNQARDAGRRAAVRPARAPLTEDLAADVENPLEAAIDAAPLRLNSGEILRLVDGHAARLSGGVVSRATRLVATTVAPRQAKPRGAAEAVPQGLRDWRTRVQGTWNLQAATRVVAIDGTARLPRSGRFEAFLRRGGT